MARKTDLKNKFTVGFHGTFIPLQGVQFIIRAAKELEHDREIVFEVVGSGQKHEEIISLAKELGLKTVNFVGMVPLDELPVRIRKPDICLGIFGDTQKALQVIPNKVYECIAMRKPVITSDTPAIRELFTDRENILLCRVADSKDLADKILVLKKDKKLMKKIAEGGYNLYKEHATPKVIAEKLLIDLKKANIIPKQT